MPVQLVDVRAHLESLVRGEPRRVDARTSTTIIRNADAPSPPERGDHPPQEVGADARAANGDDADLLVLAIAELVPDRGAVGELSGIKTVT